MSRQYAMASPSILAMTEPTFWANTGDPVWLTFSDSKVHLFDQATERRLTAA